MRWARQVPTLSVWNRLGDQAHLPQPVEHVEKCLITRLIGSEAHQAAFRHIRDHFDGATKVGIGMPWGNQASNVGLFQTVLGDYLRPYGLIVRHLLL